MTTRRRFLPVALFALLAGCGSSPEPIFFALSPASGRPSATPAGTVEVRQPGLAGYLDRAQVLSRFSDPRLSMQSTKRWGEPLARMTGRVLAEDIAQRLPSDVVFSEGSGVSLHPDVLVETQIERFDMGADGVVTLKVQTALHFVQAERAPVVRRFTLTARASGADTDSLVLTMSGLLAELADGIASFISQASRAGTPASPSATREGGSPHL